MPRKDPSEKIDILGKPDCIPEQDVAKFVESKNSEKLYKIVKAPVWDSVGESLENFYLSARLEHSSATLQKELLMEHQRIEGLKNTNRIHRLQHTQAQLRNGFVEVNGFLREFEDKRKTALKKCNDELKIQEELRSSTARIQSHLSELTEFRHKIKATSDELEPYENVLEDVVQNSPIYSSVKDLMDRCDALMLAQVDIVSLVGKKTSELDSMKKRLVAIANAAALQVLGLKNALSSLDRLYEAARSECLKWEKTLSATRNALNDHAIEKDSVFDGINHIYRLLCQRRSLYTRLPYEALGERLDFILDEMELLQEILQTMKNKPNRSDDVKPERKS